MDHVPQPKTIPKRERAPIRENIRKVAVTMLGETTQFIEMDQTLPLAAIVGDLTERWKLPNMNNDYSLQFTEPAIYITERNRHKIENGNVLRLTHSPAKTAERVLLKLRDGRPQEKAETLHELKTLSSDQTFAQEFIAKDGHLLLITMVEGGAYVDEQLANLLKAFVQTMDHQIVSWEVIEQAFVKQVSSCLMKRGTDVVALQSALEIMESIILYSATKSGLVEKELTSQTLISFLQSGSPLIQKAALALINAILMKAVEGDRKNVCEDYLSRHLRHEVQAHVMTADNTSSDMKHELYKLQRLMFNLLQERMTAPATQHEQESLSRVMELRNIAFHFEGSEGHHKIHQSVKRQSYAKDYKKLGFQNTIKPIEDFNGTPPGVLTLDNMYYFAKKHAENYKKVVLENSCKADEHDCPVAKASVLLTGLLCDILKVGEEPLDEGMDYYPMFFTHDKPFQEFYSVCIQLLSKTWREMRATTHDFPKVLNVVGEQVGRILARPGSCNSFETFRTDLYKLSYSEITSLWQQERQMKDAWESQVRPIVELKERLKPEILDLIRQQRLNFLIEGGMFPKVKAAGGGRHRGHWFCRLSPNQKVFHYNHDASDESVQPSLEQLPHKLPVVDIKSMVTGKDCPHIKDSKTKGRSTVYAFSILSDTSEQPLNFIANSERQYNIWTDGINTLLGNPMTSPQTSQDLETLLSMEIKIRLLDLEGVTIPEEAPPTPKEPANYNFCYKY